MSMGASPASGDIVITRDAGGQHPSYVLSLVPHPAQVRCQSYQDAKAMAARWASTSGVTVWISRGARTVPIASDADGLGALLSRIQGEYLEMPGLVLTGAQAQRLWGLDGATCTRALDALVTRRFLVRGADMRYRRATEGAVPRWSGA